MTMHSSMRLWSIVLLVAVGSSCGDSTGPQIIPAPPILFQINGSTQPGAITAIYAINPDGTGQQRLTDGMHYDGSSAWSPDGRMIAFSSNRDGQIELYTMRADGSRQERLTHTTVSPGAAAPQLSMGSWSAKSVLAYVHNPPFASEGMLMTMPAGGGTPTALTTGQTFCCPDWSPDGNRIVFTSTRVGGTSHLFISNADGTGVTQITSGAFGDGEPSWSPDGQHLAFTRLPATGPAHIWVVNIDGTNPVQVTTGASFDGSPSWSPDGTEIAFVSSRDGEGDIYIMKADGTNVRRVTTTAMRKIGVRWRRTP